MSSDDYEQYVVASPAVERHERHVLRGRGRVPAWSPVADTQHDSSPESSPPARVSVARDDGSRYVGALVDGKYRVDSVLGAGGMGVVVAATHVRLGTSVAIKLLRRDTATLPDMARRFLREARAASRLRSDHVCRALDVGQLATGEPYIVMERMAGSDLATVLQRTGSLSPVAAAGFVLQACEAIAEAHALGMIHRDLKPANLFLTQTPHGAPHVKVLDFGLATAASDDASSAADARITRVNVTLGSPHYMPPEQLRSAHGADARSDIWALGITLYELLTGATPFHGESLRALSLSITLDPHPPLDDRAPRGLAAVIDRCLDKQPELRFQNVAELAATLAPYAHHGHVIAARVAAALGVPMSTRIPAPVQLPVLAASASLSPASGAVPVSPVRFPDGSGPLRAARPRSLRSIALAIAAVVALATASAAVAAVVYRDATSTAR